MDFYQTIEKTSTAEFRDRGSKFLAYAFPIAGLADFRKLLAEIKKEHPKASHHCFAYRIGTDGTNFRVSDDGEPSGSAGRPILGQIDSKELTNVLVIVVRYFGGSLLGVPGLITAYKTAAAEALQSAGIVQKQVMINYDIEFDYTRMNDVMRLVKQNDCKIISQDLQLFCKMEIGVPKLKLAQFLERGRDLQGVKIIDALPG